MKNNIFIVIKVTGESFRLTSNKLVIPIKVGDTISEGEIIVVKDGSVSLQDTSGAPIEIPQNTALMLHEDGVFAETPESVSLLAADLSTAALSSPLSPEEELAPELDQDDTGKEVIKDGHTHVRLERINFDYASEYDTGRDANEINVFETRATRNPRINFKYEHPGNDEETLRVDIDDPYSRDGWTNETSGWFNRAPEVSDLSVITDEDIPLTLDLLKNAVDPEGHPMKILSATALHGTVIINPDGTVTYSPNEDYHGSDTITYKVTDIYGGVTEATVKVTVNPVQDAFDDADTTDEDTPVTLDVMLNDTFGPNAILTSVTQGSNGTVTFDKYGNVTYTPGDYFQSLNDGETATDTFTYTVTTAGGNTETATVTITIIGKNDAPLAIADINTVHEDAADQAGHDDSNPATTIVAGNVMTNDSDVDSGDVINVTGVAAGIHSSASGSVATAIAGTYGTVVINADGTYIYTLDNSRADVQALANGQEVTDTFTYTITDSKGATATTTLTVTVVGTNDDPKIYLTGGDTATGSLTESDTTLTTTGTLSLSDVDIIDVVNATKVDSIAKGGTYTGTLPTDTELKAMFTVTGNLDATETDKANGITWNFNSGSHYFDGMAAGETLTLTYTVQVADPHGGIDTHDVVITITGTNDAPTILAGGTLSGSATELVDKHADENTLDHTTSGYFDVKDADLTDAVSVSATPQGVGYLGTFTPSVNTQTTGGATGKITWEFKVNDSALDHLAEGETVTQLYDVTVDDGKGGTDTVTVTVTITGSNDAPEIHVRAGDSDADALSKTGATLTTTGTLSLSDVDIIDVVNATKVDSITKGGTYIGTLPTDTELKAMFTVSGNLNATETDKTNGITWNFDSGSHYFDGMAAGETLTLTYTVQVADPHGGIDTHDVVITITGTNDAPTIIAGGVLTGSATELVDKHTDENAHDHTTSGYFDVTDANLTDTISVSATPQGVGYLGTFTPVVDTQTTGGVTGKITWEFKVNDSALDHLAEGETVTQLYDVTVDDGKGGTDTVTVTVTITGSNDAPEIHVRAGDNDARSLTESDTTLTTTGTLSLLDVDIIDVVNATKVDSIAKGGTYTGTLPTDTELKAMFTVSGNLDATETDKANGITWNFNSGSHYFDGMAAGETLILTYTVQVADPHGGVDTHDVVITITGTNDAPTIIAGGVLTGSATELVDKHADENTLDHTTSGYFDVTDADLTDAVSVSATPQGVGYLGTFTPFVDTQTTGGATGKITWEFKVNDSALDHLAKGETVTQLYDVTVDDGKGGTDTVTVTVTITGTNDAPEIHVRAGDSDAESLTESNIALTATGKLSLSDVDIIDVVNATKVDSIAKGGTYTGTLPTDTDLKAMFSVTGGLTNTESDKDNGITWTFNSGSHLFSELAAGETLILTYTVQVTDPHGGIDTKDVVITITGTNDAPIAVADVDNVKEDVTVQATGNVLTNDTDIDAGDTKEVIGVTAGDTGTEVSVGVGSNITGTYGTLVVNADGTYTYDLDNSAVNVQELLEGQKVYDVFTYTMQDSEGAKSTTTITITIEGTNDIPVAVADIDGVKEDDTVQATGNVLLNDTDVDAGDTKEVIGVKAGYDGSDVSDKVATSVVGTYGFIVINADGTYTYDLDNSATNVQELREGQKVYDVFTYTMQDSEGAKSTTTITITVEGTNDAPIAVADVNEVKEDVTVQATGNVLTNDTDIDAGDTKEVIGITAGDTGTEVSVGVGTNITGTYGTLVVNADGTYTYDLDNLSPDVQSLAEGQKVNDIFTYTVQDSEGAKSTTTITIVVEGTNDAPDITVGAGDSAAESLTETDSGLSVSGTLSIFDIDTSDTVTADKVNSITVGGTYLGTRPSDSDLIAMFTASGGDPSTFLQSNPNGITWEFDSGSEAFNEIPAGQTLVLTYTVRATDNHGLYDDQTVTITITGTNDAPVAVADTNTVTEDAADQAGYDDGDLMTTIVGGNVLTNDSDIDHGDTFEVTGVEAGTHVSATGNVAASVDGTYGSVVINADGTYSYTLDNTKGTVQALAVGETVTDTFTYTITDSQGATATTTLTITVVGTNDKPVIHVIGTDSNAETITETNAGLSTSGTLSVFDVDTLDTVTADKVNSVITSGTYTGPMLTDTQLLAMFDVSGGDSSTTDQWSYQGIHWTFNSGTYPFDEIPAGETLVITYTVKATDNHGASTEHDVTITITGTNDAPVAVADVNDVKEDVVLSATGNVLTNDSDIDHGDTFEVTGVEAGTHVSATGNVGISIVGAYGSVVINASGTYTYTLDNSKDEVQALAKDQTVTDTFTYTITDSQGGTATTTLTITVEGTNDKPVIHVLGTDSNAETITETNAGLSTSGTLSVFDIDTLDTVTADKVNSVITSGTYTGPMLTDTQLLAMFDVSGGDSSTTDQWSYQGIHWTFNSGTYPFDEIPAGETLVITYTVKATDNHGASTEHDVTITITGTNDAPVAVADTNTVTEDAADQAGYDDGNPMTTIVGGNVLANDTDIDHLDTRTVTGVEAGTPASATGNVAASVDGTYGSVIINADGTYSYTLDNTKDTVQALAVGETVTDTFTYTITDSQGATATTTLTITVVGANDDPVIHVVGTDSDAETITETNAGLSTSGTLSVFDIDTLDTVTAEKVNSVITSGTYTGPMLTDTQLLAMFDVSGGDSSTTDQWSYQGIHWTFNSGTYPFDEIPAGETLVIIYTVRATDNNGAYDDRNVIITITGTNDAPVAVADTNTVTEDAADQAGHEDGNPGTTIVAGNVITNDSDIDHGDTFTVTGVAPGTPGSATGNVATYVSGTYGYALINADGTYTYTLDNGRGIVQALAVGETVTDTFTYTITDSQGATATTTLTITVVGKNDKPVIHVLGTDSDAETLTETNAGLSILGTLTVHDIDTLDTVTADKVNSVVTSGTYSGPMLTDAQLLAMFTVSGGDSSTTEQWSYQGINWKFDSGTYPFDEIPAGETLVITYTVRATDNHGLYDDHTVTITITGTNDVPKAVADTNTVYEDAADQAGHDDGSTDTTIVAGNVLTNDSDIDHGDTFTVTGVAPGTPGSATGNVAADVTGTYGTVKINADGTYTYTLDNSKPEVQALAKDQTVTDTFTYTITDSQGGTATTTLTITVVGTNDKPEIRLDAGDSDAETLTETNAGLSTSGTLSVYDVDTLDTPVASKVNTVSIGGTYSGPVPDNDFLIAMFTVTGGNNDPTNQYKANGIGWTFNSDTYPFDELPTGETLILTYTVQLDDGNGGITTKDVTITIIGTNDDGVINDDIASINEDTTLLGNVLSNDETDPDFNEPLEVFSFTVDSDGDGVQDSYTAGDTVTITTSWGTIGTLTLNADGSYEFIPYPNYSGPVPTITYNAGNSTFSDNATLNITVDPVSDKPTVTVDSASITTDEDTSVALGLKMPLSTDTVDQNGPGVNGDNPELLGAITLSGIPAGAQLLDGTNSNALLWTSGGGSVTIVLTDQTDYHINGASGTLYMTKAQYEALQVLPPADSGVNFSVTVSVTSYEVDNSGNPLSGVPGAINTATVDVDVRAVTDDVELWIDGVKSTVVTIDEDTTLNLSTLLTKQFNDTDGSEQRSIVITGLPAGTVVNGTTIDGSGTITIPLTGGNTIPSITVKPPKDFSGDINNITITLRAQDTDSDSSHTPNVESDSVTLNIYVNPIAGDVKVSGVTTDEDTAVKFLQHLEVTDTDGSEEITGITVKALQVGWVIRDGGGNIIFTGDGATDYTVSAVDVASEAYKNYTVTPPAHSSQDEDISISVETTDTQTVNGSPVTSVVVTDMDVTVEVAAVPEVVGTDTDGDGTDDLTMNPDHNYSTPAYEDTWFDLQQNGFNLKNGWNNQDPDELTYALLKPILNGGLDSAVGSQFKYYNGSTWITLTYNGSALEIPVDYLDTVQFKAAHNVKGMFEIEVQAKTVDVDPDTGNTVSAISGSASLTNVVVLPIADKVTLSASSPVNTPEDTLVNIKVRPSSSDSSETFNITIANIPPGAKIYYDGVEQTVDGDGKVLITEFSTSKTLAILPPHNSNENFTLNVIAQSVDTDGGHTSVSDPVSLPISVIVKGVADPAILDVKDFTTTETIVDGAGHTIALSNVIDNIGLTDTDGSETLTLILTGLEPQFSVVGATYVGGDGVNRVWIVDTSKLATTHIVTSENFSGTINLNLRAITTENDGDSLTGALKPVTIEVTPSPESTIVSSTTTHEDTPAHLNFNIVHHNDDNDETLTSVWIKASDVEGKNFTLYYGSSTTTTLADAAADSGIPLVVLEDGYYKLTGSAINNIYGKGAPNTHGSFNFAIKYEITDPSSDSTLPSVTEQTDTTYNFIVNAVTDQTETSVDLITGDKPSVIISGNQITVTENSTVSVTIKVEQAHDPNANNQQDYDGSEQLITIVVDGVPNGVTVGNAVYIGNTPGNPNTGQWLIQVNPNVDFNGPLTHTVVLYFDGTAAELSSLNQSIIISAHSEDFNSVTVSSSTVIVITTPADFDDTGSTTGTPVDIIEAEFIPLPVANEDSPITLADIAKFTTNGTSDFSITLTGLPPGTIINGMVQTTVNGETVWTASGTGGNAALQALLASIIITPPPNWNSNNSSNLSFDATLTTYSEGGIRSDDSITINQPITPVTDDTDLSLSIVDALEGNDVTMTLNMSNPADNTHLNIIGEKLYVSLDETGMDSPGTLWHDGNQLSLTHVSGVTGVADGYYYIVEGVTDITQPVDLIYRPAEHSSGQATITTTLVGQEDNAANIVTNSVTETLTVEPVNSGYDIHTNNISGSEDSKIALDYTSTGLVDTDGSEYVLTAILGNLPNGYLVYYGADEASAVLAHNLGADAFGNTSWSIPINGGGLPPYIAILPPEHYSGTITDLTLSVISGENGLDPEISTATFDMEIVPFADGLSISPTSTFGNEGDYVSLNLNASIIDTDGSETVTLEIKGLGEYASFYSGTSLISSSYDSATNTYTVSGIAASEIDNIAFIQSARTGTIEVKAYTVETANGDTSASVTGTFEIDIFETIATPGDDTLLYSGGKALDGFTGNDTVVMRFNEGIDFDTDPAIRNIEIFDLRGDTSGSNALQNLSVQDVIDMTDSNNTLTIYGDSNDSISILDDGNWITSTVNDGGIDFNVYTHVIHTDVVLRIQQDLITQLIDITVDP